ncbi:hypothetical protein [Actinokineospora enzanensis]|uniref:hypothetical protein n=1 Tax=Actinokineospora enzanensis TaxID=155975 RepID=UPI00037B0345|nr:hypothetical protein [Actinokineospora enzanensis]
MSAFRVRLAVVVVLASVSSLGFVVPAAAVARPVKAEVKLKCRPGTWRVDYTAGSGRHAPGAVVTTRIDLGVVDEYGPDKVTGAGPYGLGSAATTGDIVRTTDGKGAWSIHEVLSYGPRPSGYPRSHRQTTTVTLYVDDGNGPVTATDTCTLMVR